MKYMAGRITVNSKKSVSIKEKLISRKRKTNFRSNTSPVNRILYLQRTVGNQAVQRMVRSKALQAKLRIGQPGDVYEQEADRVADAVMRMPEPGVQRQFAPEEEEETLQSKPLVNQITPLVEVQRQEEPEEEEEEIQPKSLDTAVPEVTPEIGSAIQSIKSTGQPLSASERAFFEPRFGADFGHLRVHTNAQAASLAHSINASAFTIGHNVVFGAGEYSSDSLAGRKLLAHELTHTVQQGGAGKMVQRKVKFVTNVPKKGGDCGTYSWGVQWKLTAPANKKNGGWIVQKINVTPSGIKDDKTALTSVDRGRPSPKFPYWEAWRINPGKKVTDFAEGGDPYDDTYGWSTQSPGSKGKETAKGDAQFYDNLKTLPADFKKNNSATYAGILYSTKTKPTTLKGGTGEIDHTLVATWNCLKGSSNKKTSVKVTPDP